MFFNPILLALLPGLATAVNDWSKPRTSGTCSYGSGDGINTAWSSLVIVRRPCGAPHLLAPLLVGKSSTATRRQQTPKISASFVSMKTRAALTSSTAALRTRSSGFLRTVLACVFIVYGVPSSPRCCPGGPFARVVTTWVDEDQTLPARLAKRGQTSGQVRGLALDFDFSKIPESRGKVYITAAGTNSPAQRDVIHSAVMKRSLQPIRHANRRAQADAVIRDFASPPTKRSPLSFGDAFKKVSDGIDKAADAVGDGVGKVVDTVGKEVDKAADKVADGVEKIIDKGTEAVISFIGSVSNATKVDETLDKKFDPITVNKAITIIDQTLDCPQLGNLPSASGHFKVTADVHANVTANVGFIVTGTIVPLKIDKLAFTGGLIGGASAIFNISANAQGTLETPSIKIFEIGLPGLEFPGLLSIGPSFSISAHANTGLDIVADMSLGTSIDLSQMQFTFPASAGNSSADIKPKDSLLQLNVGAPGAATGNFTAHLVPRIDIGVTILNGAAGATVFADVDASTELDFNLCLSTTGGPSPQSSFGGSVGMNLGVSVNVGTEAALEPFFDKSANFQLFQKTFPLFTKDFGDPPPVKEGDEAQEDPTQPGPLEADQPADDQAEVDPTGVGKALRRSDLPGQLSKRALVCANGRGGVLTPIINAVATALK